MISKLKYRRALASAVLMIQALPASSDVIYREVFGRDNAANSNFLSLNSNWGWVAYQAGGVVMTTGDASIATDANTPSNIAALPAVNSGTTGITLLLNGRATLFQSTQFLYTAEYVVNRQLNDITTVTWDQRGIGQAFSFAVQIDGTWYASASVPNPNAANVWNTASLDFKTTTWRVLNFAPGSTLALATPVANVALPDGNITAFGLFLPTGGGSGSRVDGVTINATPIVIPNNQWAVGSGDWDTTSANWRDAGVGPLITYIDGNKAVVTLNDTATADPVLINLTADRTPITFTVDSTINYSLSGFALAGDTFLTKGGTSILTLSNANTYAGLTSVNAGTIRAGVANAIPSGAGKSNVAVNGGALSAGTFDINGLNLTINGLTGGAGTVKGTVLNSAAGAGTLTLGNNDASATFAGDLVNGTGTLALVKIGSGIQTISGLNTYTGGTTVTAGSLVARLTTSLPGYDSPGKVVFNGGTLATTIGDGIATGWTGAQVDTLLANATKTSGSLGIVTTNGSIAQSAAFSSANLVGGIGLTKLGTNTLTLDQINNYTGTTTVSAGTLRLGHVGGNALPNNGTVLVNGGTLDVTTNETIGVLTLDSGVVSSSSSPGSVLTVGTYNFANTGTATFALPLSGVTPLTKTGSGVLGLTADNSGFSGGWNLNEGGLSIGSPTALGSGPLVIANGTSLDSTVANLVNSANNAVTINGDLTFIGTQALNLGTGALTLGNAAGTGRIVTTTASNLTLAGVIANGTTATSLTKAGAGGLTLSAVNTYTGRTTVREGTLNVVLNGNINVAVNSPLGNTPSGTNVVVGTTTSTSSPILGFIAGSDGANYTFSRLIDSTQGTAQTALINFNGDGAGGLNTNTLTLEGDVAALYLSQIPSPALVYSSRQVRISAQRSGMTINITGNMTGSGQLLLGSFPADPNVDGRGQGTIRFSNLERFFTGTPALNFGSVVIDGVVGAVGVDGPIGAQAINLNPGSSGNIVGNANFQGSVGSSRDTSVDTVRGLFLDSAGSSYARNLIPGGGGTSTQGGGSGGNLLPAAYGTGTVKTVNVINGYLFGGKNVSGSVLFSGNISPADVTVGSHPTNVIATGINMALLAETGGTVEFSGVISDTPIVTDTARVTINQLRNHPNLDGFNNTTLNLGPDGLPDSAANQLVGTAKGGTVVLSAPAGNTYEGGTEILGGTLLATNISGSATGVGTVTIQAGGRLGGSGFIAPTLTSGLIVNSDGAISLVDGSASGDFDVNLAGTGNATFNAGAKLAFDVAASGTSDLIKFTGLADSSVAFNNTIVDLSNVGGAVVGATYTLMTFDAPSKYTGSLVVGALPAGIAGATFGYNASNITVTLTGVAIAPAQPTTILLNASGTTMNLSWTPSARATSYTVRRSTTDGSGYVDVATNITGTSYQDNGLTAGTTYYYVVTATNAGGTSINSSQSTSATLAAAPASLTATTTASASVTLNWTASPGATGYIVRRSTINGSGYVDLLTVNAPTVSFVNNATVNGNTVANGTTYYYVVASVNAGGPGANSVQASATPLAAPAVVTGLTATAGNARVNLSWNAAANAATYTIRRSTITGTGYSDISAGAVAGTTYLDTTAVNGTTYFYVIASVNTSGTSANSAQASATPVGAGSLLDTWRTTNFPGSTAITGPGADSADFDADGLANLVEYALGTDPKVASASPVTVARDVSGVLKLTFPHIADAKVVYTVRATNDLAAGFVTIVGSFTGFATAGTTEYIDTALLASTPRRFLRLEISTTP